MTAVAINVNKASAKMATSGCERWRLKWPGCGFDSNLTVSLPSGIGNGLKAVAVEPDELGLSPSPAGWSLIFGGFWNTEQDGRPIKILTLIDEYSRQCLALVVDRSIKSDDVLHTLSNLFLIYGIPENI